jgi:dCTP deaminase
MMLSDRTFLALINDDSIRVVPAPGAEQVQPVSLDLLLGTSFTRLPRNQWDTNHMVVTDENEVRPGEFMLACTRERIRLPNNIAGVVCGKSTWARRGLLVEAAGLVDPGFDGTITLELKNMSHLPIPLRAGVPICQISFYGLDAGVLRPYGTPGLNSHYQGQTRAEPARG